MWASVGSRLYRLDFYNNPSINKKEKRLAKRPSWNSDCDRNRLFFKWGSRSQFWRLKNQESFYWTSFKTPIFIQNMNVLYYRSWIVKRSLEVKEKALQNLNSGVDKIKFQRLQRRKTIAIKPLFFIVLKYIIEKVQLDIWPLHKTDSRYAPGAIYVER